MDAQRVEEFMHVTGRANKYTYPVHMNVHVLVSNLMLQPAV